ncbi:MAG: hypothetical protein WCJ25_03675 [Candidatus Moraniibacteriota bacterium]
MLRPSQRRRLLLLGKRLRRTGHGGALRCRPLRVKNRLRLPFP